MVDASNSNIASDVHAASSSSASGLQAIESSDLCDAWSDWRKCRTSTSQTSWWSAGWESNYYWTEDGWRWKPCLRGSRFGAMPGKKAPTAKKGPNHSYEHVRIRDLILHATHAEELLAIFDSTLPEFELFHAVTAFRRIASFGGEQTNQDPRL